MNVIDCPDCRRPMTKRTEPDLITDVCPDCRGVFLDRGELNRLLVGMGGDIEFCSVTGDPRGHADVHGPRTCPACVDQAMEKVNLLQFCDVIFDFCPSCAGLFLDDGELEAAEVHLRKVAGGQGPEELRFYHDGRLVTLYQTRGVASVLQFVGVGVVSKPVPTERLSVAVYFREPLGIALHVSVDRWWGWLARGLGLSDEQDIEVGDAAFDRAFAVQGSDGDSVAAVLAKPVRQAMLAFVDEPSTVLTTPGRIEVYDNCVLYVEGPYEGDLGLDVPEAAKPVIARLLELAEIIDS